MDREVLEKGIELKNKINTIELRLGRIHAFQDEPLQSQLFIGRDSGLTVAIADELKQNILAMVTKDLFLKKNALERELMLL